MTIQIENGVSLPSEEPPKKKSRARKQAAAPAKKTANPAASLIAALKFISPAQKKAGPTNVQFSHIAHNWAAACDGVLTIAAPVVEDLAACPNTLQFIDALSKAGDELSITQLNPSALAVSSGAFRALVPCVSFDEVPIFAPDPNIAVIDDRIKTALGAVMGLATDGAPNATFAAVLLEANSAVATNGHALLQYWHGLDLPPGMLIPKLSAAAIAKASKTLTGFGYSGPSATFWFEDGSFIKTQLFNEHYPNYDRVLQCDDLNPWPVPAEFFKAVRAVESFSHTGNVFFEGGAVLSQNDEGASTYKVEGLPERMGFNAKYLLMVEDAFKKAHFDPAEKKVIFFGENMRGAIMGLDVKAEVSYTPKPTTGYDDMDDDIPF